MDKSLRCECGEFLTLANVAIQGNGRLIFSPSAKPWCNTCMEKFISEGTKSKELVL